MPLRNPLVLGRELITLQALSSGRIVLGVGVGDYPDEFEALHVPYAQRGKIVDEYLTVLGKIFRGGRVEHHGTYVDCDAAYFYHRVSAPPIFIAGGVIANPAGDALAPPVLRRVAKLADGWMPDWGTPELLTQGVTRILELRRDYGRHNDRVELAWATTLYLADTDAEAGERTAGSIRGAEVVANTIAGFGFRSSQRVSEKYLIGCPTTITRRIAAYVDAGVTLVIMNCIAPDVESFVHMLRRFAQEVIPHFS